MYNKSLYNILLERKHHVYRHAFDKNRASDFTDENIHPAKRMAMRLKDVFLQETPVILEEQNIVFIRTVTDAPDIFLPDETAKTKENYTVHELGYVSNICGNYERILATGLEPLHKKAESRLSQAERENDTEGQIFLQSAIEQIETVYMLTDKYKSEAEKQGRDDIVRVLERVPRESARTFREALQFFRILHYTLWAEGEYHNTAGRFDKYAYPYFKRDIENGTLNAEQAEKLLEEFFITFNWDSDKYPGVQLGDNGQSMMLGGVDEEDNDCFNELSSACLRASCELKLIDPKINLRVSKNTPKERFKEATYLTKAGLGFPQYSNDDIVIPALVSHGYDLKDARNYSVAACWEFIVGGCAMDINNIGALSFPKAVEEAMLTSLKESETFDGFMGEVEKKIKEQAEGICNGLKEIYFIPAPFYSVLMDGCIENARDISATCDKDYKTEIFPEEQCVSLRAQSNTKLDTVDECVLVGGVDDSVYTLGETVASYGFSAMGKTGKLRKDKDYPEVFEYLGWCSWDAFQKYVTHENLTDKAKEFEEKDIQVKWFILDDMWGIR